jgi:MFS transporter, FSR family, fosmidomycin resistance protein
VRHEVPARPGPADARRPRQATIVVAHAVTDFLSFVIVPLMSMLEGRAHFDHEQGALLLAVGSVSSGLVQPVVALVSDRFDTRWLGTLGLAVAAVAIGLVGYAHDFNHLLLIQAFGTAGIGAFHPVATAAAGQLAGPRRARGIAIFYAAGMFGSVGAGWMVPALVRWLGITNLVLLMAPGLVTAGALAWAIHSIPHRHATAHAEHAALPDDERRRRWLEIGLLYASNAARFMVNMMLIQLVIRWCERWVLHANSAEVLDEALRLKAVAVNGPLQATIAIGQGVSGLIVGWFVAGRAEKAALLVIPLVGAVATYAFPTAHALWCAGLLGAVAGAGFAAVMPITISLAQRLLPHRTSLASALMLGGAWTLAAAGPPLAQWLARAVGLDAAFAWVAAVTVLSAVLTIPLRGVGPRPARG